MSLKDDQDQANRRAAEYAATSQGLTGQYRTNPPVQPYGVTGPYTPEAIDATQRATQNVADVQARQSVIDHAVSGATGAVALAAQEANKPENIDATQRAVQNAAIQSADAQVHKSTIAPVVTLSLIHI